MIFFNYFFIFYFYLCPSPLTTWRIFWPTMNITFALNICTNFFNFCKKNKNKKRQYITNVPVLEDKRVSSIFLIEFTLLVRFFPPPFFSINISESLTLNRKTIQSLLQTFGFFYACIGINNMLYTQIGRLTE